MSCHPRGIQWGHPNRDNKDGSKRVVVTTTEDGLLEDEYVLVVDKARIDERFGPAYGEHVITEVRFMITDRPQRRSCTVVCTCGEETTAQATAATQHSYYALVNVAMLRTECPIQFRPRNPIMTPAPDDVSDLVPF